jgi:hypothetical protein
VATNGLPNQSNNPTTARVDHRINEKDSVFIKFNGGNLRTNFQGTGSTTGAPTPGMEANETFLLMDAISGALSWTHLFGPTFFMETNGNRTAQSTKTVNGPIQQDWSKFLGLPNPFGEIGWPALQNLDFMNYIEGDNRRQLRSLVDNWEQNFTKVRGTHNIQFGWRFHREKQTLLPDQGNISGYSDFNTLATALQSSTLGSDTSPQAVPQTGDNAANFFLGYGSYNVGLKRGFFYVTDRNWGLYLQDNWKATSRLTLTCGVRWDLNPALTDERYLINSFDLMNHALVLPEPLDYYYKIGATTPKIVTQYQALDVKFETAEQAGMGKNIFQPNLFDIGPRAGLAYRAFDGKKSFVIRGGYGIYISPVPMRTLLAQFSSSQPFRTTYQYNPNNATYSPDGVSNWLLRNAPVYIAGLNTNDPSMIDVNNPAAIGRGASVVAMGDLPSMKIHEWNATLEKVIRENTVLRFRYTGRRGYHADQLNNINPQQTNYNWLVTTGLPYPTGTFSGEARRPYDQVAYTDIRILSKTGTINSQSFTLEFERRFHRGLGFQFFHTVTNAYRLAGNSFRDGTGLTPDYFLPGTVPTDPADLNRFLNLQRDTGIPKHRTRWNWNYDLPVGRGKLLARNASSWLNNLIGGWKLSGTATIVSSWYALPTNNWGAFTDFEVYNNKKYPILDCRQTPATAKSAPDARCYQGYLYYNGYISQRLINSYNTNGIPNGVFGLPADYHAAQSPVTPWPKGGQTTDANAALYDTNNVNLKLKDGSTVQVAVDTGLHPWRQQYRLGPFNWTTDASLLKFFQLKERVRLRTNVDLFNVFNLQGLNTPGSDGIVTLQNSYGGFGIRPRQLQVNARLEW